MLEWLKGILGESYTEEIDKAVSKEIGKNFVTKADFNTKIETSKSLEDQLAERDGQLEELKKVDTAGLEDKIKELQAANVTAKQEYENKVRDMEFGFALDRALAAAKAKNVKAAKALIDTEGLTLKDGEIVGLNERIEKAKEENQFLFDSDKSLPAFAGSTPGSTPSGDAPSTLGQALREHFKK